MGFRSSFDGLGIFFARVSQLTTSNKCPERIFCEKRGVRRGGKRRIPFREISQNLRF